MSSLAAGSQKYRTPAPHFTIVHTLLDSMSDQPERPERPPEGGATATPDDVALVKRKRVGRPEGAKDKKKRAARGSGGAKVLERRQAEAERAAAARRWLAAREAAGTAQPNMFQSVYPCLAPANGSVNVARCALTPDQRQGHVSMGDGEGASAGLRQVAATGSGYAPQAVDNDHPRYMPFGYPGYASLHGQSVPATPNRALESYLVDPEQPSHFPWPSHHHNGSHAPSHGAPLLWSESTMEAGGLGQDGASTNDTDVQAVDALSALLAEHAAWPGGSVWSDMNDAYLPGGVHQDKLMTEQVLTAEEMHALLAECGFSLQASGNSPSPDDNQRGVHPPMALPLPEGASAMADREDVGELTEDTETFLERIGVDRHTDPAVSGHILAELVRECSWQEEGRGQVDWKYFFDLGAK